MGMYLNSISPFFLYKSECSKPYYVDKTEILKELIPLAEQGNSHICITRPRRFGKTVMANMIGAFFGKGADAGEIFDSLIISKEKGYQKHLNQYNVIYIDFSKMPSGCTGYNEYISRIEERLKKDLIKEYPEAELCPKDTLWDMLEMIFNEYGGERFIFVLDEWDCIFHKDFVTEKDKAGYISFLSNLLKDHAYVRFSYMTGILPIAKYSSGSELNMFIEYTMGAESKFGQDFGFSESEVDMLYDRYLENCKKEGEEVIVTRDGLRTWYDGYYTKTGNRMYNPRSVVASLTNNNLGSYWTSSGPYDELFYYIEHNVDDVRKDLALMVSGEGVPAKIQEYAATSMNLTTRDEIFSAMVVYGFLSYYKGKVYIPNKELMDKFDDMIQKEVSLGYVYNLAKASERMLQATLQGDTDIMEKILSFVHNTKTPILSYNNEVELSAIVNLVYLSARDRYRIEREDKAGKGFVDFIFYPEEKNDTCIILELKIDDTPENAILQIKEKQYALRFKGKLGEKPKYTGNILAVGISYDKETKVHRCRVERMTNQIGRENQKDNDLFFTCSLIDYIARKTKNTRTDVVNKLGKKRLQKIYDLADVYHCDNIDRVSDDFIEDAEIINGTFDNVGECRYAIPSHWDIGKVYKRLIKQVAQGEKISIIDALIKVYNSFISQKIDDYNSSVYYENPSYIYESYRENEML